MTDAPAIITSTSDEIKRDEQIVKEIKPKLQKFVIDQQNRDAEQTVKEQVEYEAKIKRLESLAKDVIKRAEKLSALCFLEKRLWREHPPAVTMSWLGTVVFSKERELEAKQDMWAFTRYLFNEYFKNYMEHSNDRAGYPDPMKEENLLFFWNKFNADLLLLIAADKRRVDAGNKGVVLADAKDESK